MKQRASKPAGAGPTRDVRSALAARRGGQQAWPIHHLLGGGAFLALLVPLVRLVWHWVTTPVEYIHVLPVQRLNATAPNSMDIFFEKFHGRLPVVFEGALDTWPAMQWSPTTLSRKCPKASLPVYTFDSNSKEWASLAETGHLLLSSYFQQWFGGAAGQKEPPYGLEMSLRNECPVLLEDVRIPAPFSDDMLARYYRKGAWPTLITGPAGTRSGLHRDSHNFPFWMALFSGRKHWRIFADGEPQLPLFTRLVAMGSTLMLSSRIFGNILALRRPRFTTMC